MNRRGPALLSLALLLLVTAWATALVRKGTLPRDIRWCMVIELLGVDVTWFRTNTALEGPVLLLVSRDHGLTLADLVGLPALLVAAQLLGVPQRVSALLNRR